MFFVFDKLPLLKFLTETEAVILFNTTATAIWFLLMELKKWAVSQKWHFALRFSVSIVLFKTIKQKLDFWIPTKTIQDSSFKNTMEDFSILSTIILAPHTWWTCSCTHKEGNRSKSPPNQDTRNLEQLKTCLLSIEAWFAFEQGDSQHP